MSLGISLGILGLFNPPSKDFPPTIFPGRKLHEVPLGMQNYKSLNGILGAVGSATPPSFGFGPPPYGSWMLDADWHTEMAQADGSSHVETQRLRLW